MFLVLAARASWVASNRPVPSRWDRPDRPGYCRSPRETTPRAIVRPQRVLHQDTGVG